MNYKNLVKVSNIWMVTVLFLLLTVFILAEKNSVDKMKLQQQKTNISRMQAEINNYKTELKDLDILKFKESVLNKKYPLLADVIKAAYKKSRQYDINPFIVLAVIEVESGFKPFAVSSRGAYGLMQINYNVWKKELKIDLDRIFQIEYNIDLGIRILKRYLVKSDGNIPQALHLYNNGYSFNNEKYKYKVLSTDFIKDEKLIKTIL